MFCLIVNCQALLTDENKKFHEYSKTKYLVIFRVIMKFSDNV